MANRVSGASTLASARVMAHRDAASSPPPSQSIRVGYAWDWGGRSASRGTSTRTPSGMFIQKTQGQPSVSPITPPQSGPMTAPASEDAPISPSGTPRLLEGKRSATMAMDMGSSAPAPTAWITRAATNQFRLVVSAAATEPAMNSSMDATYRLRCPQASERRPIRGMAATYPSR